jgi:hypothetical protein
MRLEAAGGLESFRRRAVPKYKGDQRAWDVERKLTRALTASIAQGRT